MQRPAPARAASVRRPPLLTHGVFPTLVFASFLTEIKLIPSLANNVGLFEVLGAVIIAGFFATHGLSRYYGNRLILIVALIFVTCTVSLVNIAPDRLPTGLVQVGIVAFLLFFLLTVYNLALKYQLSPHYFLRLVTWAILIVGPWVMIQGFRAASDIEAVGPFRNRSHMGIYMLTAFWLVLLYALWPERGRLKVLASGAAISLCLYAVAISGRRSVYLSLFLGLAALLLAFLMARRGKKFSMVLASLFSVGFIVFLYAAEVLPRTSFFRERVGLIGDRLASVSSALTGESQDTFFALQLAGVRLAFSDHPVIGIGWGGFVESTYSPTGHEVHSTPLRFLAETGIVGLSLYVLLLGYLMARSANLFARMRASPYGNTYLALMVGLWSLTISYLYNRHVTERTFWLLLAVFLLLEAFAFGYEKARRSRRVPAAQPRARERPAPALAMARAGAPPAGGAGA